MKKEDAAPAANAQGLCRASARVPICAGKELIMNETLQTKRTYKDSVFRMLYSRKEELLSLYNALNGTDYQDPENVDDLCDRCGPYAENWKPTAEKLWNESHAR